LSGSLLPGPRSSIALVAPLGPKPIDVRDRALLLLGFAGALRRSELVGLDITEDSDGLRLVLRRSKTDQEGETTTVGLPYGSNPDVPNRGLIQRNGQWR
jgi:integrase